jgi:protein deglycase
MSSSPRERILVPLAPGFEEIEAVTIIDVLRRADQEVWIAGLEPGLIRGSHGVGIQPDLALADLDLTTIQMLVCPGGMPGTRHLLGDRRLLELARRLGQEGRRTAAICAAPLVLRAAGLLDGKAWTAHPSVHAEMGAPQLRCDQAVVRAGLVTTSSGVGTALAFALDLVAQLCGPAKAEQLARAMVVPGK